MLVLSGIAVIIIGFVLRFNPLLVVTAAALVTGWAAGFDALTIVAALGKAFNENRYVSVIWIILPVIGLLERFGLQERARTLIAGIRAATVGRLLLSYMLFRQLTAAIGLNAIAGHAQTVRPLVAPMAVALAEAQLQPPVALAEAQLQPPVALAEARLKMPIRAAQKQSLLPAAQAQHIRAMAAATDNIGLFFGEDIFLAVASILLIKGFLENYGIILTPFSLSVWAIPTAIAALLIHGFRLWRLDRRLAARQVQA